MLTWTAKGKLSEEFIGHHWKLIVAIQKQRADCNAHWLAVGRITDECIDNTLEATDEARRLLVQLKELRKKKQLHQRIAQEIAAYAKMGFSDDDLWAHITFECGIEGEQAVALLEWGRSLAGVKERAA